MSNLEEDHVDESAGLNGTGLTEEVFSKRLPDDNVEYSVFVVSEEIKDTATLRERLRSVQNAAKALVRKHLNGYIWQRQEFGLSLKHRSPPAGQAEAASEKAPLYAWSLHGSTCFGDSIADEWLIVWLLKTLSSQFSEIWIQLEDADGQFLLVEAANKLPKWLNPEIADNRVWINNGRLVVIPLAGQGEGQSSNLSLEDALSYISNGAKNHLHDEAIETEAFFRIRSYPEAIDSALHLTLVQIPRRLAYILHRRPASISPAVDAFYLRDPISLKPLATKNVSTLQFAPVDLVAVSTCFTRVSYAQLRSQEFGLPPAWIHILPQADDLKAVTGMKLTCGFEMLLQDKATSDTRSVREIQLLLSELDAGDDEMPSDAEIAKWEKRQDDEKWLDINFEDLERELRGERGNDTGSTEDKGFGDAAAQANLRKLVDKFQEFMADENAGVDGVEDSDDASASSDSDEESDEDEPDVKDPSTSEPDFEASIREVHNLSATDAEHQDLSNEARRLALEMEDEEEGTRDDDAEAAEVMRLVAQIRAQRAAKAGGDAGTAKDKGKGAVRDNNQIALSELAARAHSSTQRGFIAGAPPPKPGQSLARGPFDAIGSDEEWEDGDY